jgi:hypothetical protein
VILPKKNGISWDLFIYIYTYRGENLPGGSLKYLFVYLKIRIFKCSYIPYFS